jgi:hypothetical protein
MTTTFYGSVTGRQDTLKQKTQLDLQVELLEKK